MQADRRRHVYLIGMTGTGKTGLLLNMMHADLLSGAGFCFLDPHGDASQHLASLAPRERSNVIYLDPSDPTHTFAYNPLSGVAEAERATAAANIVSAFKNIWAQSWGPRLEYILGHSLRLLLDTKDQTLLGLPRLLVDETYRGDRSENGGFCDEVVEVVVKVMVDPQGQIDHFRHLGDNFRAAAEPREN